MMTKRIFILLLIAVTFMVSAIGCARRRARPTGNMEAGWTPEDIRKVTNHMANSIEDSKFVKSFKYKSGVMKGKYRWMLANELRNNSDEHIDTRLLVEKIRTRLIQRRLARFIDEQAMETALKQLDLQQSALFDDKKAVRIGKLVGARFVLRGSLSNLRREAGVYYNITMQVVDLQTLEIVWTDEVDIERGSTQSKYR